MSLVSRSAVRATQLATRQYSRSVVKAEPKLHNATGRWDTLKSKRPIDQEDLHTVFHPPFNPATIWILVTSVVALGGGSMWYGMVHQQYKQGFWK